MFRDMFPMYWDIFFVFRDVFQEGDDLDPLDDSWEEHLYSEPFEPFNEDLLQSVSFKCSCY